MSDTYPKWWLDDREYLAGLLALEITHRTSFVHKHPEHGWMLDFEAAWRSGLSSGERIILALGWCLFNLGWATEFEYELGAEEDDEGERGPLFWSNPARAIATLDDRFIRYYFDLIEARSGQMYADA